MTTQETIGRKWTAGAELAAELERILKSGRATRKALEVERYVAVCRGCDQFRADTCARLEILRGQAGENPGVDPEALRFAELLCHAEIMCTRWSAPAADRPVRRSAATTDSADGTDGGRRADELLGRIARMHEEGAAKSQAVRKLERNAARRRAQRKKAYE